MTNPLPDNAGLVERLRDEDLLMHATPHQLHDLLHEAAIALEASEREIAYVRERQELDLALANKFRFENATLRTRISELEKNAVDKRQIENQDQDRDQATHRPPPWEMSRI